MESPYRIIESKIARRQEFDMTDGKQPTYALFYLQEGSFSITMDGATETVKKGELVILSDTVPFRRTVTSPIVFLYIKFEPNFKSAAGFPVTPQILSADSHPWLLDDLKRIAEAQRQEHPLSAFCIEHCLNDILLRLYAPSLPADRFALPDTCEDPLVRLASAFLGEHLPHPFTTTEMCRQLGTNQSTLSRRFRRAFGCTVWEYTVRLRIQTACHLLNSTTYSVTEIAGRCGYDNVYYFSNAFKKAIGETPTAYRQGKNPIFTREHI